MCNMGRVQYFKIQVLFQGTALHAKSRMMNLTQPGTAEIVHGDIWSLLF